MTNVQPLDQASQPSNCCGPANPPTGVTGPKFSYRTGSWIVGKISTAAGDVPVVATKLNWADKLGTWKVRWGIGRMTYRVEPRLYAVGHPNETSPVFVTANYKLSFDCLRSQLDGVDGWILVLDTRGINVWCAAGKGTFSTDELGRRAAAVGLKQIITHRRLIVPQLGATGVSAHTVRQRYGFYVTYGPIRATDIPEFLKLGMKATPVMRRVTFTFPERLILIPVDLMGNLKYGILASAIFLLLSGLGAGIYSFDRVAAYGITNALLVLLAVFVGAVLPAALLPWLPGRAFSIKGAWAGLVPAIGVALLTWLRPDMFRNWVSASSWFILLPAVISFIGMNFTGSSTYTSLSGVKREMRIAVPAQISCAVIGLAMWIVGLYL